MPHLELLAPLFLLVIVGYSVVTGEIPLNYPLGNVSFRFYSEPSNVDRDWTLMPFFLGAVILLGFFAIGPDLKFSPPAPTYIADVDSSYRSVKSVKSVSHKPIAHHKHTSHAHQAQN